MHDIQVKKDHYYNVNYNHKARWITYFYQMNLLKELGILSALEVGPGHGWMKKIIADLGVSVETVDFDPALKPDYVGSIEKLPNPDNSYDAVCAFEVLEHLPFETLIQNLNEMARVAKKYVIFSVPDHRHTLFHINFKIPFFKYVNFMLKINTYKEHKFDGQHYWEIGKKGYSPKRVKKTIESNGFKIVKSFVPTDTPTNHFFVLIKE